MPDPVDVFVLGAPRSGTTWLQAMLGAHPEVVSPQETGIVHQFLAPWAEEFDRKLALAADGGAGGRVIGLPVVLTHERFRRMLREVLGVVAAAALEMKPGARIVVEKTPDNARHVELIRWLAPEARFIHIVRDGRDVAASLVAARSTWGGRWAPADVRRAAQIWRDHTVGARSAAAAGSSYAEVRYTDLLDDGPNELVRLFAHCGVTVTVEEAAGICERFTFDRMASSPSSTFETVLVGGEAALLSGGEMREPDGFFRVGKPGSWQEWGRRECWAFDDVAGDLLVELGFEDGPGWCASSRPAEQLVRAAAGRARAVTTVARGIAGRLARRAIAAGS